MKKRESIYKNTKSFLLGIFIGVIVLLLISNFLYPLLSKGNANLNQDSDIGSLYQFGGDQDPSEDYNCNDEQNKICKNLCYMGCEPADNPIGFQCKNYFCLEPTKCDGKGECFLKNPCDGYDCPPCKKCEAITTIPGTKPIPLCNIPLHGTVCDIKDNICNHTN